MRAAIRASLRPIPSTSASPIPTIRSFCTCIAVQNPATAQIPFLSGGRPVTRADGLSGATGAQLKKTRRKTKVPIPEALKDEKLALDVLDVMPLSRRPTIVNGQTAKDIVTSWGIHKMEDVTIVEAYPGAGGLTKAFLDLPNVKQVIAVEQSLRYGPALNKLKDDYPGRLSIRGVDPFGWEAYSELEEELLKDVPKRSWDEVHPNIFFAAQLPQTRHGDQLFVQLVTTAAGGALSWLFKYGRMRMGFVGLSSYWSKILAEPNDSNHHKLAVLLPTLAEIKPLGISLEPAEAHFHRPKSTLAPMEVIEVVPRKECLVKNYEALEYVTRHLFVAKNSPWTKAVPSLAIGAKNLVPLMIKAGLPDDDHLTINGLSLDQWAIVADVFNDWPFKPQVMFDDMSWTQLE